MNLSLRTFALSLFCIVSFAWKGFCLDPSLGKFLVEKKNQIYEMAEAHTNKVPQKLKDYFEAVRVDDWPTATNLQKELEKSSGRFSKGTNEAASEALKFLWPIVAEVVGTCEDFHEWDNHCLHKFGTDIISSIPPGSIYFGGTDPGRFIISATVESQARGIPFFVLTQNQLVDPSYRDYIAGMYQGKINLLSDDDATKAFQDYMTDAQKRLKAGKLKPGEEVSEGKEGRIEATGPVPVMAINGNMVKILVDKNPTRRIFVEESYPLEWMYPNLSPRGLIMELHHEPVANFSSDDFQKDADYWQKQTDEFLGKWMTPKTTVSDVCAFCEKTYCQKDLSAFTGDKGFAKNQSAQKAYSKLRSAHGYLFEWRSKNAKSESEKTLAASSADYAYRQAMALCPYSPETVYRFVNFLILKNRKDDALRIVETAIDCGEPTAPFKELLKQLKASN